MKSLSEVVFGELEKISAERDELRAQVAVMREALERAGEALLDPPYYASVPEWITEALSPSAGKEWLERVQKLEEVAGAARSVLIFYDTVVANQFEYREIDQKALWPLRQSLAELADPEELEGGNEDVGR